jgi:hypothetical protein
MIKRLVFHDRVHAEEIVARVILQVAFVEAAEKRFPGVSTAQIQYFSMGMLPREAKEEDYPEHLFIGCGKGQFDEHHVHGRDGACAATIVADELGLLKPPQFSKGTLARFRQLRKSGPKRPRPIKKYHARGLQKILADVLYEDERGSRKPYEIPTLIKMLHDLDVGDEKVMRWGMLAYQAEMEEESKIWQTLKGQARKAHIEANKNNPLTFGKACELVQEYYSAHAKEFESLGNQAIGGRQTLRKRAATMIENEAKDQKVWTEEIRLPHKPDAKLLVVITDNPQTHDAAWSQGFSAMVKQDSNGNVVIMSRHSDEICLKRVAAILRKKENFWRSRPITKATASFDYLQSADTLPECPEWHLHDTGPNKEHLYNGTNNSARMVSPTMIPLEDIVRTVQKHIRSLRPPKKEGEKPRPPQSRQNDQGKRQEKPRHGGKDRRPEYRNDQPQNFHPNGHGGKHDHKKREAPHASFRRWTPDMAKQTA